MYKFLVCCSAFLGMLFSHPVQGSSSASSFDGEPLGLLIDDKLCQKNGLSFITEEGVRFTIKTVKQRKEKIFVKFSHTEGTESLIAPLSGGDYIEAVPDLSYDVSQTMAAFLEQENAKGRRASRKSIWNKDGEVSFEEGELWTPKIIFSTVFSTLPYKFMDWLYESDQKAHQTRLFVLFGFEDAPESAWQRQQVHAFDHVIQGAPVEIAGTFYCDENGKLHGLTTVTYQVDTPAFVSWKQANGREEETRAPYQITAHSTGLSRVLNGVSGSYKGKYLYHESSIAEDTVVLYVRGGGKLYVCTQNRSTYKTKNTLVGLEASETRATLQVIAPTLLEIFVGEDVTRESGDFYQNSYFKRTAFDGANGTQDWREIGGETQVRLVEKANPDTRPFSRVDVTQELVKHNAPMVRDRLHHFKPFSESLKKTLFLKMDAQSAARKRGLSDRYIRLLREWRAADHNDNITTPEVSGSFTFGCLAHINLPQLMELCPTGKFETDRLTVGTFARAEEKIAFLAYLNKISGASIGKLDLSALNIVPHTRILERLIRENVIKDLSLNLSGVDIPRTPELRPLEDAIITSDSLTVLRPQHFDLATTDVRERNREPVDRRCFTPDQLNSYIGKCRDLSWIEINMSESLSSVRTSLLDMVERSAPTLVRLDLSHTRIPASAWTRIFNLLPSMKKLEHLEIHHTNIGNERLITLAEKLRSVPTLKIIEMDMPYIVSNLIDVFSLNVKKEDEDEKPASVPLQLLVSPLMLVIGSVNDFASHDQGNDFEWVIQKLKMLSNNTQLKLRTFNALATSTKTHYKNKFSNPDRVTFQSW